MSVMERGCDSMNLYTSLLLQIPPEIRRQQRAQPSGQLVWTQCIDDSTEIELPDEHTFVRNVMVCVSPHSTTIARAIVVAIYCEEGRCLVNPQ